MVERKSQKSAILLPGCAHFSRIGLAHRGDPRRSGRDFTCARAIPKAPRVALNLRALLHRGIPASALAASLGLAAPAALAGTPAAISTPATSAVATGSDAVIIDEVVVTAQKRVQTLQSVPVSVSALSGDDVRARQIANFDDLSRTVPGLTFDFSGTEGVTNISIRGVSSQAGSATVGPLHRRRLRHGEEPLL